MPKLNRTLFEASFSQRPGESEDEFLGRIEHAWTIANLAMGVDPRERVVADLPAGEGKVTR